MLNKSREHIRLLKQGGKVNDISKQQGSLYEDNDPGTAEVNHVNCYKGYVLVSSFKESPYDSSLLQVIVDKNKHQGSAKCMKIMGLVTYITHKWRDKVFLKHNKICNHQYHCTCKQRLLKKRTIGRPFLIEPIGRPMKIDGKFDEYSARDIETLIKVGLHMRTILYADHNSMPAVPRNMTNYTRRPSAEPTVEDC